MRHGAISAGRASLAILLALATTQASAQTFKTLACFSFSTTIGQYPTNGVVVSPDGSMLYGTTTNGGAKNDGTVFSLSTTGGPVNTLLSFSGTSGPSLGQGPNGLALSGSTLFGTTNSGGAYPGPVGSGCGTVFSLPTGGGAVTTMLSFNDTNGLWPEGTLLLNGSTLYGTTYQGGVSYNGTVFSIPTSGGAPTSLFSFSNVQRQLYGTFPQAGLTLSGTTLYGTDSSGGAYGGNGGNGTVFSVPTSGGTLTTLLSFAGSDGQSPYGNVIVSGSTMYGMASSGGPGYSSSGPWPSGDGTIFSMPITGGAINTLLSFTGSGVSSSNGQRLCGGLTLVGSTLYGMTEFGGAYGQGNIFSIKTDGSGYKDLVDFNWSNGAEPFGNLTQSGWMLYGTTSYGGTAAQYGGTVFALNIAPAAVGLSSTGSAMIISGGTATLGMTVSNTPSSAYNLNYALSAAAVSGSAAFGSMTSGTVAPGSAQPCTVSATSTNLGVNAIAFTASDPNSLNLSQTTTAALTVYDHANASVSPTTTQTSRVISFGNLLRGASMPSQNFTIYNLAANTSAQYTASLKQTGSTAPSGDSAFSTNLSTFSGLTAYSGSNGNTFTAALNTANYTTTGISTIALSGSQLADDSSLPGVGNNNNGGLTITLQGNVGNATADASNSPATFGPALTASVAVNGNYANLESTVKSTTGSGGSAMVGTTATILAGTNSSSGTIQTVSMAWRTQTSSEGTHLASDVLHLSGMALNGIGGQTSPFVLQLDYDPDLLGGNEALLASEEMIQLEWLNPVSNQWESAMEGNVGANSNQFHLGAWPSDDMTLGDWGVNTVNHTVWAVLDHNSDFAVVPEPSTLALLAATAIGLVGFVWRRGAKGRTAKSAVFDQLVAPAILSFPSQASSLSAARRAA